MKKKNLIILLVVAGAILALAGIVTNIYVRNQQANQGCTSYLDSAGQEIFKHCVN